MSRPSYTAVCRRVGDWWAIEVPQLRGVHSQARRLDQVEAMAREAIALLRGVSTDGFDLRVEPHLDPDAEATVAAATAASQKARGAAQDASLLQREAARTLLGTYRLTVRDAGTLLRLSPQRVSQLAAQPPATRVRAQSSVKGSRADRRTSA
jgi:hypothetical protein